MRLQEVVAVCLLVWQQVSSPCVSGRSLQGLQKHNFDMVWKEMRPPSSPDLNPMDFFVCGYLEGGANRRAHNTKNSLITSIKKEMASMDKEMVKRACASFRGHIQMVIDAEMDFLK